jgi:[ribosomal protein S5]-alanine N-acetyltransferase
VPTRHQLPQGYRIDELAAGDASALAEAYLRNREHLARWDPRRDPSFYTVRGQAAAVQAQLASVQAGLAAGWVIRYGDQLVGRVNLNNIVMGALRSASVGYWVDVRHGRKGLATAAVDFACESAAARGLHRVEAGTLLDNEISQRVLESCGFEAYGLAPRFLFIDGAWRDHRLFQRILHDDPM